MKQIFHLLSKTHRIGEYALLILILETLSISVYLIDSHLINIQYSWHTVCINELASASI